MKNLIYIIFCLLIADCNASYKQKILSDSCNPTYDTITNTQVYTFVEEAPLYPGGTGSLIKFFEENFKYHKEGVSNGLFMMEFVIDNTGALIGQRIRNKSKDQLNLMETEALRVLQVMPKWRPGKCKGKAVNVLFYLPLNL